MGVYVTRVMCVQEGGREGRRENKIQFNSTTLKTKNKKTWLSAVWTTLSHMILITFPHGHNLQVTDPKPYTGCPRRNVQYFGRVFLMLNYNDITQNTYIQS